MDRAVRRFLRRLRYGRSSFQRLKAVAFNVLSNQLLELTDALLLLRFRGPPEFLNLGPAAGVGDVLVEPPQAIQPPTEIVDQIAVVDFHAARLAQVFVFVVIDIEWSLSFNRPLQHSAKRFVRFG